MGDGPGCRVRSTLVTTWTHGARLLGEVSITNKVGRWAGLQGKVTISNDGATIMRLLEVVHPAAKTLVDISMSQDAEVRTYPLSGNISCSFLSFP